MKAVALISGGLDSILAERLIKDQGIEVICLNFRIPFCHRGKEITSAKNTNLEIIEDNLSEKLKVVDISEGFLKLLENPRHGFGSNMNPCIDCKILMLSKAKQLMQELGAQFIVTGEVLGQRPMSQHRDALQAIAKKSGLEGLVLRPLSAKNLPETIPEINNWVNRDKLLNFGGRTRRPQIELAAKFGIRNFAWPAGGCLLTEPEFSKRLKEIIARKELNIENVALLKIGRHFRIGKTTKLIVGRNELEDIELEKLAKAGDYLFYPNQQLAGPTCLGKGEFNEALIKLAAQITCRYCDLNTAVSTEIMYVIKTRGTVLCGDSPSCFLRVSPLSETELVSLRI
ncbi:MAG: tRNA 4-thiouridine(8) synthase ThiI [Candidatus Omnitrophota bacterium]